MRTTNTIFLGCFCSYCALISTCTMVCLMTQRTLKRDTCAVCIYMTVWHITVSDILSFDIKPQATIAVTVPPHTEYLINDLEVKVNILSDDGNIIEGSECAFISVTVFWSVTVF